MLIRAGIENYLVRASEKIVVALNKINKNKSGIVFVVDESGALQGSLSDGDLRRSLLSGRSISVEDNVLSAANDKVVAFHVGNVRSLDSQSFSDGVDIIPLVDALGRVSALAFSAEYGFYFGDREISESQPSYLIAEIGNNHNGCLDLAFKLVDLAKEAGADCVKFQLRDMDALYKDSGGKKGGDDLGTEYTKDLLRSFQLKPDDLFKVFDHCKQLGLPPLCTPWDMPSFKRLEEYGVQGYKVASADFTNHELLSALANSGKPLFCSTGMCTEKEIEKSVEMLGGCGAEFALLHCNSTYPTPYKDVNLKYLKRLKKLSGSVVGYSGHERGGFIPVAAVALGAKVIEKHFTIDKSMEGNDHRVSLLPEEFSDMVSMIRNVEEAIGTDRSRQVTQGELINRENLAKSLVASRDIGKGERITKAHVDVRSPGQGLQPIYLTELVGKDAPRSIKKGDYFHASDLAGRVIEARNYSFARPFGIPVRYHDYRKLTKMSNLDFVEFHLSYGDLDLDFSEYLLPENEIGFAVHSPELFSGDHILDLASTDSRYVERSVYELGRVCSTARALKSYFPSTESPVIVVNAGGFSVDGFKDKSERAVMYERVASRLSEVDQSGVQVAVQTMPPFPWHFGGQSYHNLFVDPGEMSVFCREYGVKLCLDISHSAMACSYYGWDLFEFVELVGEHVVHLHIVDALGVDGEGVKIGEGDVNFKLLSNALNKHCNKVQFIPEVWQGHKNSGEGFWEALEFLEGYL